MNDPKKPMEEPRRVSQPDEVPAQPPMQAPSQPNTEYERSVPHQPEPSIGATATSGEGSYSGTTQYQRDYQDFAKKTSPDDAMKRAEQIDPNDPSLARAEKRGKNADTAERVSTPSIH